MKVVLTYGTFDLFHVGHLRILERAKALGDRLVVGISTDEFNAIKDKRSVIPFDHRKEIVESIRYVDLVIPEKAWEQKVQDIQKHAVDVFVMGDDWTGKFDSLKEYCQVVYLPRTEDISSTQIRTGLGEEERELLTEVSDLYR
jgi:glycerol-3-phosphate cytidylyltransferase